MAGVAVVTDSTASLPADQVERYGVRVVALQVVIDEVSRPESDVAVTPALVAESLRKGQRVTTSRPPPDAFPAVYGELAAAGHRAIVSVHLSRAMSATVEAAATAARSSPVPVTVVDSTTLGMGMGFAVLSGADAAARGADAVEVAELVRSRASSSVTFFYVDTLEHLRRGGRIGGPAALLGSALSVKPLLTVAKGSIRPYERVRTAARALARLEDLGVASYDKAARHAEQVDVAVHHLDGLAAAEGLADRLQGRLAMPDQVTIAEVSAVLGAHVGPGTLGIVVSPRP